MWGGVRLGQECCILLLSCRGKPKHPEFAAWWGKRPQDVFAAPCSASSLVGAFKSSWKNCGREQRTKSLTTHNQQMWGSRSWWLGRGKTWEGNHEGHGEKICRNPDFFTCPVQTIHWGSWWVQVSLAVTWGQGSDSVCLEHSQKPSHATASPPSPPDMAKTLFIQHLPLAHRLHRQAPQFVFFKHW